MKTSKSHNGGSLKRMVRPIPPVGSFISVSNYGLKLNPDGSESRYFVSCQKTTRNLNAAFPTRRFKCVSKVGAEQAVGSGEPNGGYLYRVKAAVHQQAGLRRSSDFPVAVGRDCNSQFNHKRARAERPNMNSAKAGFGLVRLGLA